MKPLLLISEVPDDRAFAAEVAGVAGLSLKVASSFEDAGNIIASEESVVIFVDASTEQLYTRFEAVIQEKVGLLSDKINPNHIHFISSNGLEEAPYLVQSPLFGHFIARRFGNIQESGALYGQIVAATQKEKAFGLGNLLKPGAKVQSVKLQSTGQKQSAVEAVKNYLISAKFQNRVATLIANAVDEVLMNAMFDAPVDNLGRHIYAATPRSALLKLEGKNAVELQIGFDGTYVGVTAIDLFGSLKKEKLWGHISKVYSEEEYRIRATVAGAGIGLGTVFRTGGSFVFVSEGHERTEVSVLFRRTDNFREFKDQFRFISTQFYF